MGFCATCLLLLAPVAAFPDPFASLTSGEGVALQAPKPASKYSPTITFCLGEIKASFAALDANGDGVLSKAEVGLELGIAPATKSMAPAAAAVDLATTSSASSATSSDAAPAASAGATASTAAPAAPTEVAAVSAAATEAIAAEPASSAVLEASPPPPPPPSPEASLPPPAAAAATTRDVLVTVPVGVVSGEALLVTSPFGGQLRITVPAGAPAHPAPPA